MAAEESRDTALDAAAERAVETRLGAAWRMRMARVQQAASSRSSPRDATRMPRGSRAPRVGGAEERGAARCELLDSRASLVLSRGGGGGAAGEAGWCRRLRRLNRAADSACCSRGSRRPKSAPVKRCGNMGRPNTCAARLSGRLGRPTEDPRRGQSAGWGGRGRAPEIQGLEGGPAGQRRGDGGGAVRSDFVPTCRRAGDGPTSI